MMMREMKMELRTFKPSEPSYACMWELWTTPVLYIAF